MKTYLFIDGTNLYASQYELFGPQKYLNFSKFIEEIEKGIKVKLEQPNRSDLVAFRIAIISSSKYLHRLHSDS